MLKDREQNLKLKKYTAKGKCNAITSGINIPEEHSKKKDFFFSYSNIYTFKRKKFTITR